MLFLHYKSVSSSYSNKHVLLHSILWIVLVIDAHDILSYIKAY